MPPPTSDPSRNSFLAVILAALLASAAGVVLFFLTLGAAGMIFAIGLAIFGLIGLQYLIWGWWLGDLIRKDAADEGEDGSHNVDADP